jgi:hypothetical protein
MEENTCSSFDDLSHTSVDFIFEMVKIENEMVKKSMDSILYGLLWK